ncbi:MAG: hypothetical protein AAB803_00755, partial [Patescibacteria group bacterium]
MHPEADQHKDVDAIVTEQQPHELNALMPHNLYDIGATQPQDMYVTSRGSDMQPTYPGDEKKDPAQPPPGCPYDKNLYKDIYDELLQKEAAKTSAVNLSDRAQRRDVHMRVVDILRPQVRENRKYLKQDREGPPVAEGPEFIMKDGGIYYPRFRKSLQQMYEDQKR